MALQAQLDDQKKHVWNIDEDIPWNMGVNLNRYLLPLDEDAVAFPGASAEQQLALSQALGIMVNTTISEMEDVAFKIRDVAWRSVLRRFPVNPEMVELGEQFFAEEAKHAALFRRYNDLFCEGAGIDPQELGTILPNAYGAIFQRAIIANSKAGGYAFWWVLAIVEEVSLLIYQNLYRHRKDIDPLFFHVHKRHFEEESRHTNYAFMMLDLIRSQRPSFLQRFARRFDFGYSELFSTGWILAELHKFRRVKDLAHKHPWFAVLASCIPLMEKMSSYELVRRLFVSAPYISLILNHNYHKYSIISANQHGAFRMRYPQPIPTPTHVGVSEELTDQMDEAWQLKSS